VTRKSRDHAAQPSFEVSSKGCTPISTDPAVAPIPPSNHVNADAALALDTVSLELSLTRAALVVTQPATIATGPPIDLVISLHCFLI
jgi:hypothetical protein